jgi:transcription elongation factor Elf1
MKSFKCPGCGYKHLEMRISNVTMFPPISISGEAIDIEYSDDDDVNFDLSIWQVICGKCGLELPGVTNEDELREYLKDKGVSDAI